LRLFSFGGYGLALAALALVVFGAIECPSSESAIFDLKNENKHEINSVFQQFLDQWTCC